MKTSRFWAIGLAAAACLMAGAAAADYVTQNYMAPGGADWEVGGTLNVQTGGKLTFNNVDKTAIIASTVKRAEGEVALTGTNPTTVATGMTSLTSCTLSIKESAAPGVGTTTLTYTDSGGTLSIYAWKPTSSANPTLIASTGTETVAYSCPGA